MKIYAVTELEKPFVYLSTGYAYEALGEIFNCETKVSDYPIWKARQIDKDSSPDVICLVEACYLAYINMSIKELRSFFPNGTIIVLGSDTIYYLLNGRWQIDHPEQASLLLETMQETYDAYQQRGWPVDYWMWTGSKKNFDEIKAYCAAHPVEKDNDFASILYIGTLDNPGSYRNRMREYIRSKGYGFLHGGGGHMDVAEKCYEAWNRSRFNLGTTSHGNDLLSRIGHKGWRDFAGVMAGALLIYDDNPVVRRTYYNDGMVPLYDYDNFQSILDLAEELKADPRTYNILLQDQERWAYAHTIEKQLATILVKWGFAKLPE